MTVLLRTDLPNLLHRGKVRDNYDLGDYLLIVATDRISAFDVVLPNGIPEKGAVLAQLSAFWFRKTAHLCRNHLAAMAYERDKVAGLPASAMLASLPSEIVRRATVARKAQRVDVECVVRGYLSGSAWAEYRSHGTIGGMLAPKGLRESDRLPEPLFTPTTKAETGHDMPMSFQQVADMAGEATARALGDKSIAIYTYAHDEARRKGIIIADTKFEFGYIDGAICVIDEMLTPDSSRFWDAKLYAPGASQPSFDKQIVRDWLTASGWNKEPPAPTLPDEIVQRTSQRYQEVFRLLTGERLR
ncbi:MAG: phosphoribosylaminoimidazolesuccinocarboxamide synthase [Dehalococcoidia bacterium]|nr:phosphoribosylaminoimidazolesuccinocarboxamide synthase [Dehalococcoidia bacterium]